MTPDKRDRPTLGVLVGWQVYEGSLSSFLAPLFKGISVAAHERGCNLLLACGHATGRAKFQIAWPVVSPDFDFVPVGPWNTDGLIVVTPLMLEAQSRDVQEFIRAGHPVVFAGGGETGPSVRVDNASGIHQALAHLAQHGH